MGGWFGIRARGVGVDAGRLSVPAGGGWGCLGWTWHLWGLHGATGLSRPWLGGLLRSPRVSLQTMQRISLGQSVLCQRVDLGARKS